MSDFYDAVLNGYQPSKAKQEQPAVPPYQNMMLTAQPEPKEPERFVNPILETWRLSTTREGTDDHPFLHSLTPFIETFLLAWTLVGLAVFVRLCLFVKIKTDKI